MGVIWLRFYNYGCGNIDRFLSPKSPILIKPIQVYFARFNGTPPDPCTMQVDSTGIIDPSMILLLLRRSVGTLLVSGVLRYGMDIIHGLPIIYPAGFCKSAYNCIDPMTFMLCINMHGTQVEINCNYCKNENEFGLVSRSAFVTH